MEIANDGKVVIKNFVNNKQEVLRFAQSLLEKHINDKDPETDNSAEIAKKESEKVKYTKRLNSLIELRLDGEIDKEMFQIKKEEIDKHLESIEADIQKLKPQKTAAQDEELDHEQKINMLRLYMENCLKIDDTDEYLSPRVIKAFIRKIVVYKDYTEWHLRFRDPDDPDSSEKLVIEGKRKNNAEVSSLGSLQYRLQSLTRSNSEIYADRLFYAESGRCERIPLREVHKA